MDAATVTAITSQVSFTTVIVGLGVVFGAIALVMISMKGGKMLIGAIR
jgi:hypothetical protein